MMCVAGLRAQIPAEVLDILEECEKKLSNPAGLEMEIKLRGGTGESSMNGIITSFTKGDKSFNCLVMKSGDKEVTTETGYDGVQEWRYTNASSTEADTLYISKAKTKPHEEYGFDMGIHKAYQAAKLMERNGRHEIVLTQPKDKDMPPRVLFKINKGTYYPYEMLTKQHGVNVRLTLTKVKVGVDDTIFQLDLKRYPNAVVVRK